MMDKWKALIERRAPKETEDLKDTKVSYRSITLILTLRDL